MEDDLGMMEDDLFKLLITLGSFCTDTVLVSNRVTNFNEILLRDIRRRKPTMTSTLSGKMELRASYWHFFLVDSESAEKNSLETIEKACVSVRFKFIGF